ncbi:MAG: FxLYD domain-containing protein [Campylobacterota bacterium]|nr:FxLYD domain-containing protein [Campylobacterota bacterium]
MLRTFILFCLLFMSGSLFADSYGGEIVDAKYNYRSYSDSSYLFTIGHVQNNGEYSLENVTIEVQFFNKNGEVIDVANKFLYGTTIAPKEKAVFKVQTLAAHEKELYASQKVRILDAKQDKPCNKRDPKEKSGFISELIGMMLPIIIFFAIFIFLMRKYQGKGSGQERLINLMDSQVELIKKQNGELSKIADAITKKNNK